MKTFRVLVTLVLGLLLAACSENPRQQIIDGVWNAQLTNTDGTSAFTFQSVLTQAGGTQVNVTGLVFTVPAACFSTETSQSATFTRTGDVHGRLMGHFEMTVTTTFPEENNVLTLQGSVDGTMITGTWSLTGGTAPCNGSGDFQMAELPAL
jgi:hypothetical protein